MRMSPKLEHYPDKCISCGACVAICEKLYELNEDGISVLKGSTKEGETGSESKPKNNSSKGESS